MPKSLDRFIGTSLGEVKRLGWFGLAADPPTLAHRKVVDAVLGSGLVQKLVVFAAAQLPYKSFEASDWQRAQMMELWKSAADFGDEVILSRFDLQRDAAITWIELWKAITQMAPSIEHFLVVGSEQYNSIADSWDKGEELLQEARFIVIPRAGSETKPIYPHHHLLDIEPVQGSSTAVRAQDFSLVDEKVRNYIVEEGLYVHD